MAHWIFKLANQNAYVDIPGEVYVFDNRHSIHVAKGGIFIYFDKTRGFSFTATGTVTAVFRQPATKDEFEGEPRVRQIYTARLDHVIWFDQPYTISPRTRFGRLNRARLGIEDVNALGWAHSIARLGEPMYEAIIQSVREYGLLPTAPGNSSHHVPDSWSSTRKRKAIPAFDNAVMARSGNACVVCGTMQRSVLDTAHLSPYASDPFNRANPANGIYLCAFCHRAHDARLIGIHPDGSLVLSPCIEDEVALHHFRRIDPSTRREWLEGVSSEFLWLTTAWAKIKSVKS